MEQPILGQSFDPGKVQEKLNNVGTLSDLTGPGGAVHELLKQALERILKGGQQAHLGYEPYKKAESSPTNILEVGLTQLLIMEFNSSANSTND